MYVYLFNVFTTYFLQEAEAYEEEEYPFDDIEEESESNVHSSQSDSEMA